MLRPRQCVTAQLLNNREFRGTAAAIAGGNAHNVFAHWNGVRHWCAGRGCADNFIVQEPEYFCIARWCDCLKCDLGRCAPIGNNDVRRIGGADDGWCRVVRNIVQIAIRHVWGRGVAANASAHKHVQKFRIPKFIHRHVCCVWICIARAQTCAVINRNCAIYTGRVNG